MKDPLARIRTLCLSLSNVRESKRERCFMVGNEPFLRFVRIEDQVEVVCRIRDEHQVADYNFKKKPKLFFAPPDGDDDWVGIRTEHVASDWKTVSDVVRVSAVLARARRDRATKAAKRTPDEPTLVIERSRAARGVDALPVSRFGGKPLMRAGQRWPRGKNGLLTFIGQLRFEELYAAHRGRLPLPRKGLLSFFYDAEDPTFGSARSDAKSWRFFFVEDVAKTHAVESEEDDPVPLRRMTFRYEARGASAEHKICGRPDWIQGDELGTAKLLWQIDSDDDLGFCWFDVGRLYVLITAPDLRARRFEKSRCIIQSH
jgi:uncharacterized protein YwqG